MKRIYLARDIPQAQLVVDMLDQQFISAKIENAHQSSGLGELAVAYPEVWLVRETDFARARRIIEEFEAQTRVRVADRQCPDCKESNPASFEWCWSCKADLS